MASSWHPSKGGKPSRGTPRDRRLARNPDTPAQRQRQRDPDRPRRSTGKRRAK